MTHREWSIRPRWQSAPYRPSPARREAIHGRIRPMDYPSSSTAWSLVVVTFAVSVFAAAFIGGFAR